MSFINSWTIYPHSLSQNCELLPVFTSERYLKDALLHSINFFFASLSQLFWNVLHQIWITFCYWMNLIKMNPLMGIHYVENINYHSCQMINYITSPVCPRDCHDWTRYSEPARPADTVLLLLKPDVKRKWGLKGSLDPNHVILIWRCNDLLNDP